MTPTRSAELDVLKAAERLAALIGEIHAEEERSEVTLEQMLYLENCLREKRAWEDTLRAAAKALHEARCDDQWGNG